MLTLTFFNSAFYEKDSVMDTLRFLGIGVCCSLVFKTAS